jgi:hypothetical protein
MSVLSVSAGARPLLCAVHARRMPPGSAICHARSRRVRKRLAQTLRCAQQQKKEKKTHSRSARVNGLPRAAAPPPPRRAC